MKREFPELKINSTNNNDAAVEVKQYLMNLRFVVNEEKYAVFVSNWKKQTGLLFLFLWGFVIIAFFASSRNNLAATIAIIFGGFCYIFWKICWRPFVRETNSISRIVYEFEIQGDNLTITSRGASVFSGLIGRQPFSVTTPVEKFEFKM